MIMDNDAGFSMNPHGKFTEMRSHGPIEFIPIFHGRMEFAAVVREALLANPPRAVAVELPGTWREPLLQAVNRLPFLSLILSEEAEEEHPFLAVEPTDGMMEALRTARELGIPVELIDLDVEQYPMLSEPAPDTHALYRIGYAPFMEAYYAHAGHVRHPQDEQRETMMAHALQQLANGWAEGSDTGSAGRPAGPPQAGANEGEGQILCVLGAAHLPGVLEKLREPQPRPLARAKGRRLRLYNWSVKSSMEFMTESPFLAAAYEKWRTEGTERTQRTGNPGKEAAGKDAENEVRDEAGHAGRGPHREEKCEILLTDAAKTYHEQYFEQVDPRQMRQIGTFAKKYALVEGGMVPDLFQLVTAARGVVDDDYGLEVWDLGSHYPWQDGSGLLPTIDLEDTFATIGTRKLTLRRKVRRRRPQLRSFTRKKRLKEQFGGRWKSQWSGRSICSHTPEDLVVEDYGRYLRHKANAMLTAERTRVEPFQVSLKDGVDVRETLRNWHEQKLYVRETLSMSGKMGSVVVIFDEDKDGEERRGSGAPRGDYGGEERYPWLVTWLGEHNQESDMAFYSTLAGEHLAGPGISRCEYGGFVMSFPPQRLFDVWNDPYYEAARSKGERLLLAGLDYSQERMVLYVAARPPRTWFHGLAGRMGKQLVYLPLGQLNPGTLRKIRFFHVLDGHQVREYADEYIR